MLTQATSTAMAGANRKARSGTRVINVSGIRSARAINAMVVTLEKGLQGRKALARKLREAFNRIIFGLAVFVMNRSAVCAVCHHSSAQCIWRYGFSVWREGLQAAMVHK